MFSWWSVYKESSHLCMNSVESYEIASFMGPKRSNVSNFNLKVFNTFPSAHYFNGPPPPENI